jgi:ABC-type multidrug transport system fused ATPase/permease subunit
VTKLLLRFVDPTRGKILIDGQDIRHVKQDDLRSAIAYVPQDPTLFHRTLRENILYGKPGATEEEMIIAAKKAHAHEFIQTLSLGYETLVGERGIKLSGGQRQRIALARAILKDAPILVMDEATSALDTVSENAIREAMKEIMTGKTVVMIAHRLSTVENLDRIIVLDKNGAITEQGSHTELLQKNGLYSQLWSHQVGGFLGEDEEEANS